MKRIYLDQASTSFPKAPGVGEAMRSFLDETGVNMGRGGYQEAYGLAEAVLSAREKMAAFFGYHESRNVIFTSGITAGINLMLRGLLKPGDHVLSTSMEHNAVARTLFALEKEGVSVEYLPCTSLGELDPEALEAGIQPQTKAFVMLHGSNVCGTLLPVAEAGEICRRRGVFFLLDTAQTAGVFPIHMKKMGIDGLAFAGHKGLLGPQGIGGCILSEDLAGQITPLFTGGTGSASDSLETPGLLPDRFEAGTLNLPGILGLSKAMDYVNQVGIQAIREKELSLTRRFLQEVGRLKGVRVLGRLSLPGRCPLVSLDAADQDNGEMAYRLEADYGILTRCGLHCAPLAHRNLGTFPRGAVRFSFGHWNTEEEVETAARAVTELTG